MRFLNKPGVTVYDLSQSPQCGKDIRDNKRVYFHNHTYRDYVEKGKEEFSPFKYHVLGSLIYPGISRIYLRQSL